MPRGTLTDAQNSALRDGDLFALAADTVERIAPPDDPPSATYIARAQRAERLIFRYFKDTGVGTIGSKNLTGAGATSYASDPTIVRMVTDVMRPTAEGGSSGTAWGPIV